MESAVPARPETGAVVCRNGWRGREMSVTAAGLARQSIETAHTHTRVAEVGYEWLLYPANEKGGPEPRVKGR
jgi:hypothetical protein